MSHDRRVRKPVAIQTNLGAIFASLELSRSVWLITSLSPGAGEKMSKHSVPAGDVAGLLQRFCDVKQKALARTGETFPIVVIQEAQPAAGVSGAVCTQLGGARAVLAVKMPWGSG